MTETEENVHLEVMTIQRTHHVIASGLRTKQKRMEKIIKALQALCGHMQELKDVPSILKKNH